MRFFIALFLGLALAGCRHAGSLASSQGSMQTLLDKRLEPDSYYVIVFAYQNRGYYVKPQQTHVFATWVQTRGKRIVREVDISWCPVKRNVSAALREVSGQNKDVGTTLNEATGMKASYWIMRTDREFFEDAITNRDQLKLYRALDNSRPNAVNCIHACSDVAGYLSTRSSYGISAGKKVADFYARRGRASFCRDNWVLAAVLDKNHCKLP